MPEVIKSQTQTATQKFQIVINAPMEAVWREITRTDAPIACFFNSQMYLGPAGLKSGSKMAMRTGKYTGVVGTILEVDPPRRLSHTFKFTNKDDPECKVTYDLRAVNGGTEFTLSIDDLAPGTKTAKQMLQGGTMIKNTLKSVMETGKPSFGIRVLYVLFKVLAPFSPKKCLNENWPVR